MFWKWAKASSFQRGSKHETKYILGSAMRAWFFSAANLLARDPKTFWRGSFVEQRLSKGLRV